MSVTIITCPKCKHQFSANEVITQELEQKIEEKYKKSQEEEIEKLREKMKSFKGDLEKQYLEKETQLKEKEDKLKLEITEKLKKEIVTESEAELKLLKEENVRRQKELEKAKEIELNLRKEKNAIEEREKNLELEVQRKLDEERRKIQESAIQKAAEEQKFILAEKEKQLDDMKKKIEELQLKSQLTSQQLQGEVQELELEQILKLEFPFDEILPVPKGVNGADVIQNVFDPSGRMCGSIIWESKRTKNWSEEWVQKLKDDQRLIKADIAILVSAALPDKIINFGPKDGIYITNFDSFLGVAKLTRLKIIEVNISKLSSVGKSEKMEVIYNYLRGNEFKQRVEAIVEAFTVMKSDLERERQIVTKMWAKREKQIQRVIDNTIGMHGDLHGLMGSSLPELEGMEVEEIDIIETTDSITNKINITPLQSNLLDDALEEIIN